MRGWFTLFIPLMWPDKAMVIPAKAGIQIWDSAENCQNHLEAVVVQRISNPNPPKESTLIDAADVFNAFQEHRGDAIVAPTGTAGSHWRDISMNERRDISLGGAMGQTTSAALGLALGLPDEKVVLFDAEGSLLMNLGALATVAGKKPANFYHFLLDNECYATTGGQPVPNSQGIDYALMAKGAGYASTHNFDDLEGVRDERRRDHARDRPRICFDKSNSRSPKPAHRPPRAQTKPQPHSVSQRPPRRAGDRLTESSARGLIALVAMSK